MPAPNIKIARWGTEDPAAALRRDRIEGVLIYLRWALLALAVLYLWFSENVQYPLWGWGVVLLGTLMNVCFTFYRLRRPFSLPMSVVAQGVDLVFLQLYAAALSGGLVCYLGLYTTVLVVATIRFGMWGAVGTGVLGMLLGAGAIVVSALEGFSWLSLAARVAGALGSNRPVHPAVVLGTILADAALLGYFAYLVKRQHLAYRQNEDRLRKQISEITLLQEAISAVHDLRSEDALQSVVEIVTRLLGFQRAALFLSDQLSEMFPRSYHSCRFASPSERLYPISISPELFDDLLKEQAPVVIDGLQGSVGLARGPDLQIAVPLHGDHGPLGVLVADSHDRQSTCQSDKEILARLAKSAVVAIENASLHRGIKRMANRDGLTNLYNYRYFQESLREMIEAAAGRWPVSLLMIEIDKFKRYNDTFGHRQGDKALCSFAQALQENIEPWNGLVARYGGDEFVVVLSQVGGEEAVQVAHTVHEQVYRRTKDALAEHDLPPVTMSVGVATYPQDARNADDLIEAADRAMYMVKYGGGNRVRAYSESGASMS